MCGPRVEMFRSREGGSHAPALSCSPLLRVARRATRALPRPCDPCAPAPVRSCARATRPQRPYMTSKVSMTSIAEPPASTGQPLASPTAASRLSALMIV